MTRKALVVGYGNPIRGDDGIGRVVAAALTGERQDDDLDIVSCHQLMPELAERLAAADVVVFVDADAGASPGRIVTTRLQANPAPSSGIAHHVEPSMLLAMSGTLYGRSPRSYLVSVGAGSFALGEGLSAAVEAVVPDVIATIRRLLVGIPNGNALPW